MVAGAAGKELPEISTPVTSDPRPVLPDDPIKGRRSKRAGGYLGATAHARFWAEHKIVFDQVKYNLGLYLAMEGDYPQSNEEFFEKIIKGYSMKLPELEPQHEYVFVPEEAEEGLQIRLKPGYDPAAEPAPSEGVQEGETEAGGQAEEEPAYDIRTRAEQLGRQGNAKAEEHGVAPGGLAPVGGLGEGEF